MQDVYKRQFQEDGQRMAELPQAAQVQKDTPPVPKLDYRYPTEDEMCIRDRRSGVAGNCRDAEKKRCGFEMILHSGIILYHGSYVAVEKPELERCYPYKDFGRGFYLTTSQE